MLFSLSLSHAAEPLHSVSHVMVLPQDHRAEAAAPPCITPNAMDDFEFSGFSDTGGGGEMGECVKGVSGREKETLSSPQSYMMHVQYSRQTVK